MVSLRSASRHAGRVGGLTVALLLAASCDSASPVAPLPPAEGCDQPGTMASATISEPTVWTRAGSPWHLSADVAVSATLSIEAGALVCGAQGASLVLLPNSSLEVSGTPAAPVRLTARDSTQRWGGIISPLPESLLSWGTTDRATVTVRHAVIEYADQGLVLNFANSAIDTTTFRQITGHALLSGPAAVTLLRGSVVDTTGGVVVRSARHTARGNLTVEHTVIRGSSSQGIAALTLGNLTVNAVRIEGSAGTGLYAVGGTAADRAHVDVQGAVRITGGGSYPAQLPMMAAARLLAVQPPDSLLGNARDTLRVGHYEEGSGGLGKVVVPAGLPWDLRTHGMGDTLHLEPGAVVTFGPAIHGWVGAWSGVIAEGRADAPITIRGTLVLRGDAASRFAHVRLEGVLLSTVAGTRLVLEDVQAVDSELNAAGDVSIHRFTATDPRGPLRIRTGTLRDVVIRGGEASAAQPAVEITGAVSIQQCEITGTRSDAIRVQTAGLLQVTSCNLFDNQGLGVRLMGAGRADARLNWWGDPAGPLGPQGDGVSEGVDYIPFLTAPAQMTGR
jgi:hypothetical protein